MKQPTELIWDIPKKTIFARLLRKYYNECVTVLEAMDDSEMTTSQSEDALIELDDKYARLLLEV